MSLAHSLEPNSPKMSTIDDDEAFLYGDSDSETKVQVPLEAEAEGEASGAESDGDSESDLEIILDGDGAAPARKPMPAPPPVPVVIAPVVPATAPAPAATTEYIPMDRHTTIAPAPASLAQVQTIAMPINPPPIPMDLSADQLPHASSSAILEPVPIVPAQPTIDVDYNPKDENGNDLFEIDIESFEDKPWRKPGANQADWFNYGMNESAWKNYSLKQRTLRQSEIAENNPFARFASGNVTEAWQSLAPEFKAVMMATIMGFQPGMNPAMMGGGMNAMDPMGGMNAMNPMGGMGSMPMMNMNGMGAGYGGMDMNNYGGAGNGMEYGNPMQGFDPSIGNGMMNGENGNVMQDGEFSGTPRGPSLAEHNPPPRAPLPVRERDPLPTNVPTGPRNRGGGPPPPPPARKERTYNDKDRGERNALASEGLDYGGGEPERSPAASRRREEDSRNSRRGRDDRDRKDSEDRNKKSSRSGNGNSRWDAPGELTGLEKIAAEARVKKESTEGKSNSPIVRASTVEGDGDDIIENEDDRRRRAEEEDDYSRRSNRKRDDSEDRKPSRRSSGKDRGSSRRQIQYEDDEEEPSSSRRHKSRRID